MQSIMTGPYMPESIQSLGRCARQLARKKKNKSKDQNGSEDVHRQTSQPTERKEVERGELSRKQVGSRMSLISSLQDLCFSVESLGKRRVTFFIAFWFWFSEPFTNLDSKHKESQRFWLWLHYENGLTLQITENNLKI